MNADTNPPLLTDGDEDQLIHKLAAAYKQTETPESEEWVRVIAEKTSRLLTGQAGETKPPGQKAEEARESRTDAKLPS